ncbi:hypothetical protein CONPUDRAFT_40613, partial [Coniophora puteana RWD-64-598 SS2]
KPPYVSGTCTIPPGQLRLFFTDPNQNANFVDLKKDIPPERVEALNSACQPAMFGRDGEDVLDETYRRAGVLHPGEFSTGFCPTTLGIHHMVRDSLLEGSNSTRQVRMQLDKMNVYAEGAFFKAHKDTPRDSSMFGSLVVVLPVPHVGGALVLRHGGTEQKMDFSEALQTAEEPTIGYVAFFSDIEHEVLPVESGHRITLTYNLYFDDTEGESAARPASTTVAFHEAGLKRAIQAVIDDPSILPLGGYLGFGLRHQYPVKEGMGTDEFNNKLKGVDAALKRACSDLGLEWRLAILY